MLTLANTGKERTLSDIFKVDGRKSGAWRRAKVSRAHIALGPQRLQPGSRVERQLGLLVIQLGVWPIALLANVGLPCDQFVRACAQQLLQQDPDPFSSGSRKLGDTFGENHQMLSVEAASRPAHV